ncbi:L,D-transpeptidase [Marinobacterium stanieri]|uniref:L,D-transpeptidase catalytic domain n=1 Tax=Marinobacterium stanieri TaxID=49186 RepID=A0A1N6RJ35_9GAMM|nr:L,D-transpeptidase [Marinobacterium stanieri]SIQ28809.1 L,D-transpeptidase catalytic domain [Marinobacterium stanieri]
MLSLTVSIRQQRLSVMQGDECLVVYPVSTASAGAGEQNGSGCTPRGRHYVRACIGGGLPSGTVFVGRRPTGEVYTPALAAEYPQRDWILTRILWLCGLETGRNRGGSVDTQRRYIYIHGTPDTEPMGVPRSHGCIRMRNADLLALFDQVQPGTPILIEE